MTEAPHGYYVPPWERGDAEMSLLYELHVEEAHANGIWHDTAACRLCHLKAAATAGTMTCGETRVQPRGAPAADGDPVEAWLAAAVRDAVGDPAASVTVDAAWITCTQTGAVATMWHAGTPPEWADVIDDLERRGDSLEASVDLGMLDAVLDWRPGWYPETEGW